MPTIAIIIPCYNEQHRLQSGALLTMATTRENLHLIFVNDGSTDQTASVLENLRAAAPDRITILSHAVNKGKAAAVSVGAAEALANHNADIIGYADADLSTPPEELLRMIDLGMEEDADYFFGSRIKMLGHQIDRVLFRHLAGRMVATLIDSRFDLKIYDTQCGAKFFKIPLAKKIFQEPFTTSWLFDVEIFLRIKKILPEPTGIEIPLRKWKESGKSKVNVLLFPTVCAELFKLFNAYPPPLQ